MPVNKILQKVTDELKQLPFVKAVVLGGSRATGTATGTSDIDIGIYYDGIDYAALNNAAKRLDDEHRSSLICHEGEWGQWVNCGGWLIIDGINVDLIMRNYQKVKNIVQSSESGSFSLNYQTGHPHAFLDIMYRGELASCRILYTADSDFVKIKQQAEQYPPALQKTLMDFFLFEAGFSCMLAEKSLTSGDVYYLTGHIFRSVSALNQVLFALNKKWCLNEKKAVFRIASFKIAPADYTARINEIFANIAVNPHIATAILKKLCDETTALCTKINP